jgi:hypothetical protein
MAAGRERRRMLAVKTPGRSSAILDSKNDTHPTIGRCQMPQVWITKQRQATAAQAGLPMSTPRLEGMHAATASTVGWIEAHAAGPECLFCDQPAWAFKPLREGTLATIKRLWWCRPCETTWVA